MSLKVKKKAYDIPYNTNKITENFPKKCVWFYDNNLDWVKRVVYATLSIVLPQVLIEGTALTVRCILTVLLVLLFPHWGVMTFALAQVSNVKVRSLTVVALYATLRSCETVALIWVLSAVSCLYFVSIVNWKSQPSFSYFMSLSINLSCLILS